MQNHFLLLKKFKNTSSAQLWSLTRAPRNGSNSVFPSPLELNVVLEPGQGVQADDAEEDADVLQQKDPQGLASAPPNANSMSIVGL